MSNVTELPGVRVLNIPEKPPKDWFRTDADWYIEGATIKVQLDGPDEGRAQGIIQPPPGMSRYMSSKNHPNYGRPTPDARQYPDNFRTFNRGPIDVINAEGETESVQVGKIAVWGDHSGKAIQASTLNEGLEYLRREGRHSHLAQDIGLVGTASAVESGPMAGAVMFRGVALPGTNVREAMEINSTTMSGENWGDPQYGGQLVFAGPIRVAHTAYPYDVPDQLAAAVDSEHECVIVAPLELDRISAEHDGDDAHPVSRDEFEMLSGYVDEVAAGMFENTVQITAGEETNRDEQLNALQELIVQMGERIEQLEQQLTDSNGGTGLEPSRPLDSVWATTASTTTG